MDSFIGESFLLSGRRIVGLWDRWLRVDFDSTIIRSNDLNDYRSVIARRLQKVNGSTKVSADVAIS